MQTRLRFEEGDVPDHFIVFPNFGAEGTQNISIGEIRFSTFEEEYVFYPISYQPIHEDSYLELSLTVQEMKELIAKCEDLNYRTKRLPYLI